MPLPDAARTTGLAAALPVWHDAPWPDLPALEGDVEADVCVVGLGGSGLTCVRELRALGRHVVGLDAGHVAQGAAGRNGGFLLAGLTAFYHEAVRDIGRARAAAIYRLTLREIDRICAETPDVIRRAGSLRIADSRDEEADCDAQLAAMRADDLPVERYDGAEGRGLFVPTDGAFQPLERCRALAGLALAEEARLFERSPAIDVVHGGVVTARGRVHAPHVVVAVDGGLERLLPEYHARVRSTRLQMLATAPAPEVSIPRPVYARWGHDYWQQLPDRRVALGGGRDIGGEAEWTADSAPSATVQAALDRILRERLCVEAPVTHRWAATVGYTIDRMPIAEEARPGVWAIGGYSGTGNVLGALLGRAVAHAIVEGASPDLAPFARRSG